jgi:hypothetical protein
MHLNNAATDSSERRLVSCEGIEAVISAMKRFPDDVGVQENACAVLWNLIGNGAGSNVWLNFQPCSDRHADDHEDQVALCGIDTVAKAIDRFPNSACVQQHMIWVYLHPYCKQAVFL